MSWMYGVWSIRCAKVDENGPLVLATVQLLCSWFPMATSHLWFPTAAWFQFTLGHAGYHPSARLLKADSDINFQWATLWNVSLGVPLVHAPLHRVQDYPATFSPSKFSRWNLLPAPHKQQQYLTVLSWRSCIRYGKLMDYEKYLVGKGSRNEIYAKDMQLKSSFKKK